MKSKSKSVTGLMALTLALQLFITNGALASEPKMAWDTQIATSSLTDFKNLNDAIQVKDLEALSGKSDLSRILSQQISPSKKSPITLDQIRHLYVGVQNSTNTLIIYRYTKDGRFVVGSIPTTAQTAHRLQSMAPDLDVQKAIAFELKNSKPDSSPVVDNEAIRHIFGVTDEQSQNSFVQSLNDNVKVYSHLQSLDPSYLPQDSRLRSLGAQTQLDNGSSVFVETSRVDYMISSESLSTSSQRTTLGIKNDVGSKTFGFEVSKDDGGLVKDDTVIMATFKIRH